MLILKTYRITIVIRVITHIAKHSRLVHMVWSRVREAGRGWQPEVHSRFFIPGFGLLAFAIAFSAATCAGSFMC
jgi:hypothetical protein